MTFESAKKNFSKEFLEDKYLAQGLSKENLAKEIGISLCLLNHLLSCYDIKKSQEDIKKQSLTGLMRRAQKRRDVAEETLSNIDRDELYRLYIVENARYEDIAKHYGVSCYRLDKILAEYGIHKSKKQAHILTTETNIKKHGSIEAYHKQARESAVKTILKKSGSLEEHYANVAKKMSATKEERYGSRHYYNVDGMRKTCLEKYGVEAPCMLPQVRMHGNDSKPNKEFEELLIANGIEYEREFALGSYSYDFRIGKILIEINPTATHNSSYSPFPDRTPTDSRYHEKKTTYARTHGFRCVDVWDWDDKDKVVSLLQKRQKINARDCEIVSISQNEASDYLNKYHLQGYAKDEIRFALTYHGEIVLVMTFGNPRYNKKFDYELIRLCSHCYVVGGAEKVFSYFLRTYSPTSVVSYCDFSKFNGDVYERLGFRFEDYSVGKHWYNPRTGRHITDALLRARGADQLLGTDYGIGADNKGIMLSDGFVEIYDAGQARYTYIAH